MTTPSQPQAHASHVAHVAHVAHVREQLIDGYVWAEKGDHGPLDGLTRALAGPDRAALIRACAELLTDEDPVVRTGVIAALPGFAAELGAERLAALLAAHPRLYFDVPPAPAFLDLAAFHQPDLAKGLLSAIAAVVEPGDKTAIEQLRRAAADPDWGGWVLSALARVDSDWLVANARKVVPHSAPGVLLALSPDQRTRLIQALAPWPAEAINAIPPVYWQLYEPAEAARLQALLKA